MDNSVERGDFDNEKSLGKKVLAYDSSETSLASDSNFWTRNGLNIESFKRRDVNVENPFTHRMKARHLHMIAIGGSIGAGLFVGSGQALSQGGPGALLLDFIIIGMMMFNVVHALGELAILYPVSGSFYNYSARFIDPSWGFAMGWNYIMQWVVVLPLELTIAGITINYWGFNISVGVWITVLFFVIVVINIFGTLGYAEEEFWSSCFKLGAIIVFMILSVVLVCGGGPKSGQYTEYWGARYWHSPGAFANGFKGVCSVFVTAAFAFSGTELVGLAAAETRNPSKTLPSAIKQVFWRITLFYLLSMLFIGLLIRYDDKNLIGADPLIDVNASPFVLVGKYAGLKGFDSFMNIVILVSVISIALSGVYGGSRTLTALADEGYAWKIFSYVDKSGRPLISVLFMIAFGPLAYLSLATSGPTIFEWLQALSGLAALFTWASVCIAHIRFRKVWLLRGHTLDEIPFKAACGTFGSWLGLIMICVVLISQFYVALFPINEKPSAENFFKIFLTIPVVGAFWAIGYLWKRDGWLRLEDVDIDTGRRYFDVEEIRKSRADIAALPLWKRLVKMIW